MEPSVVSPFHSMNKALVRLTIRQSELFSGWPGEVTDRLIKTTEILVMEAGSCLAQAGERTEYLYLLASGSVRLTRQLPAGLVLGGLLLLPGDFHGLSPLITQRPFVYTATCREACVVLRIPGSVLLDIISKDGRLFFPLFAAHDSRFRTALDRYADAAICSVQARVAALLISINARQLHLPSSAQVSLGQGEMAAMLGTRRQVVNRALKTLESKGTIIVKYGAILIVDLPSLERISRDER